MRFFTLFTFISYMTYQHRLLKNDGDKKDDDKGDKDFENEDFEFSLFEVENDKVEVESDSVNYEIEYEIKCEDTDPIESKMKYKSTNSSGIETETKSRVLIHGIQEWIDDNEDGIMQDDEKVSLFYYVGENEYEDITFVGPNNDEVYDFTIQEKPAGFLTMVAHLTSNFTEYYDPNSMKFDIIINNWIYQNPDSQLALLMEYRTEDEIETEEDDKKKENGDQEDKEEGYVSQKTSTPSQGFSALQWNTTIVYDTVNVGSVETRTLNSTELAELLQTDDEYEGEQTIGIWFCFSPKSADTLFWDPSIGVYTTPLSSSSSTSNSSNKKTYTSGEIGMITVALFVGAVLIWVMTRYLIHNYTSSSKKQLDGIFEMKNDKL